MAKKRAAKPKSKKRRKPSRQKADREVPQEQATSSQPGGAEKVDFEGLSAALSSDLSFSGVQLGSASRSTDSASEQTCLEEVADDMLRLMRSVKLIQDSLSELSGRVDQMEQAVLASRRAQVQEIDALRSSLLGERKAFAALATLNSVAPWMDSLREMGEMLTSQRGAKLRRQIDGVLDRTALMLQTLGFEEFGASEGEPFDPACMECVGYDDGMPGIVLAARRPGYRAGGKIVRPAGVVIADPRREETPPPSG